MTTRWHPDTCTEAAEGKGCIIDVSDWGTNGDTPTGTVVQQCARHAALADAHADNLTTALVKDRASKLPSLARRLVTTFDGRTYLPQDEITITYTGKGAVTVTLPNASADDKLSIHTQANTKLPGKVTIL